MNALSVFFALVAAEAAYRLSFRRMPRVTTDRVQAQMLLSIGSDPVAVAQWLTPSHHVMRRRWVAGQYATAGLKGKAKRYALRYKRSFDRLGQWLDERGIDYRVELGPRGGQYSSCYVLGSARAIDAQKGVSHAVP